MAGAVGDEQLLYRFKRYIEAHGCNEEQSDTPAWLCGCPSTTRHGGVGEDVPSLQLHRENMRDVVLDTVTVAPCYLIDGYCSRSEPKLSLACDGEYTSIRPRPLRRLVGLLF
jgi:hypothetical protein